MAIISESELPELIEKNKFIYTEYFDKEFVRCLINNLLAPIDETYFRSRFVGFRNLPERNNPDRPLIYASNHSGMAFPWDAIIFGCGLYKKHKYDEKQLMRALSAPMLSQSRLMNPFMLQDAWKRTGCIDATTLNFETKQKHQTPN